MSAPSVRSPALGGVRVLDLTRYIPGPLCTMVLGDLGADVVKLEEPGLGDPTRRLPPAVGTDSAAHAALNRNKRSVAVDIRSEAGAAVVRRLAETADVLVESFRPGVLDRRGLGAAALTEANPRLVYCSLTGYGRQGPRAGRAGHDINYAGLGGLLDANRGADGHPVLPGAQVADMTGGLLAAIGILAALHARERTGRGQVVDVSLLEGVLALMAVPLTRALAAGTPGAEGAAPSELAGAFACYRVYRCRDGRHLTVGALEPKFWQRLCHALGRPDLAARQWETGPRQQEAVQAIERLFASRDRGEWVAALSAEDVCVEPVLGPADALGTAPESAAVQTGGGARFQTVASPLRLSATPPSFRREPPSLGQHTGEVLAEAGFRREEIEALRGQGVLA